MSERCTKSLWQWLAGLFTRRTAAVAPEPIADWLAKVDRLLADAPDGLTPAVLERVSELTKYSVSAMDRKVLTSVNNRYDQKLEEWLDKLWTEGSRPGRWEFRFQEEADLADHCYRRLTDMGYVVKYENQFNLFVYLKFDWAATDKRLGAKDPK